ncbi:MAG: helix-turn-helix domain-containing protein [Bacteroidales bacterium]
MMESKFSNSLFDIFELTPALVEDVLAENIDPHRHDEEELIILTKGSLEHYIDFQLEVVNAPAVCYVPQGKLHKLMPRSESEGWVITYKNEFIPNSELSFYSNFATSSAIPLTGGMCMNRFSSLCQLINGEFFHEQCDMATINHLLKALITMILAERKTNLPNEASIKNNQQNTFNTFLRILEENFHRAEGVQFYADKLNMSVRNLNLICKNNFDKSVSEIIETRKLIEAKQLLLNTDKTVSEIGYALGYNEKSYFTRVFRQKMGITPTDFRDKIKNPS